MARKIRTKTADRNWGRLIKKRDNWTCQRCGTVYPKKSRGLHAAHIFSRRFKRTRHDPMNGVALCFGCHMHFHSNPLQFHVWAEEWLGARSYALLKKRARKLAVN
jgi:5-methylcytosine-specific restriction endonuclease McrA